MSTPCPVYYYIILITNANLANSPYLVVLRTSFGATFDLSREMNRLHYRSLIPSIVPRIRNLSI